MATMLKSDDLRKLTKGQLLDEVLRRDDTVEWLHESLAELELAIEDTGWMEMTREGSREFSRMGLQRLIRLARLMFLKNPLIKRAALLEAFYVWGRGVTIKARTPAVNDLIQAFLDDKGNRKVFSGHQARLLNTIGYRVEGNVFFALFTKPDTGWVQIRSIPVHEITDIICNPDDAAEPWFYRRDWTETTLDTGVTSGIKQATRSAYYPDYAYQPDADSRPKMIAQAPVLWDAPIYHMSRGNLPGMKFGVPEDYSAFDWARAVKDNLEAYATRMQALSTLAWKLSTKGGKPGVKAAVNRLSSTLGVEGPGAIERNPSATKGSTFVQSAAVDMQPMNIAGATVSPEEGRRLGLMVAAGVGVPETMLFGDADVGNLATATTLDRPTELAMESQQTTWANALKDIFDYVIDQAVLAPKGPLVGSVIPNPYSGRPEIHLTPPKAADVPEGITVTDDIDESEEPSRTIDISYPELLERSTLDRVKAIVEAATLGNTMGVKAGLIDDKTLMRLLLGALGEDDIDETLDRLFPGNATMLDAVPGTPPAAVPSPVAEALRELREAVAPIIQRQLQEKKYSKAEREKLAAKGWAMPNDDTGGDFPIADKADLDNAIHLARTDAQRAHIKKRAKALGAEDKIPDDWD